MSPFSDYPYEMPKHRPLDESTTEALVSGRLPNATADLTLLAGFVEDLRGVANGPAPVPSGALAQVLASGLAVEKGDLLATSASNVTGPARQAAGLPNRRRNMIAALLTKLASAGLVAKTGLAAGALTMTATAAATTGNLPEPVQNTAADVIERVIGLDVPGGRSDGHRKDGDHRKDGSEVADEEKTEVPEQENFGSGVADRATAGEAKESGVDFGKSVSSDARAANQPATTPTADNNPGSGYRAEAPTADSNPGTSYRDGAVADEPPIAESNPGTSYSDGAVADEPPTAESNPGTGRRP